VDKSWSNGSFPNHYLDLHRQLGEICKVDRDCGSVDEDLSIQGGRKRAGREWNHSSIENCRLHYIGVASGLRNGNIGLRLGSRFGHCDVGAARTLRYCDGNLEERADGYYIVVSIPEV